MKTVRIEVNDGVGIDMDLRMAAELFNRVFDPLIETGKAPEKIALGSICGSDDVAMTQETLEHFATVCKYVYDQDSEVEEYVREHGNVAGPVLKLVRALGLKDQYRRTQYYTFCTGLFYTGDRTFMTIAVDDDHVIEVGAASVIKLTATREGRWHVLIMPDADRDRMRVRDVDDTPFAGGDNNNKSAWSVREMRGFLFDFAGHEQSDKFMSLVRAAAFRAVKLAVDVGVDDYGKNLFNDMMYFLARNAAHIGCCYRTPDMVDAFYKLLSPEAADAFYASAAACTTLNPYVPYANLVEEQRSKRCANNVQTVVVKSVRASDAKSDEPCIIVNGDGAADGNCSDTCADENGADHMDARDAVAVSMV
jgi:hypothetical protein